MKTKIALLSALTAMMVTPLSAREQAEPKWNIRTVAELKDGSRLVGMSAEKFLPVTLEFGKASIPLEKIRSAELRHKDDHIVLSLHNGDRLTGIPGTDRLVIETILGRLKVEFSQIQKLSFTAWCDGGMPAGEGTIFFGGVNWLPWRTLFEVQGDKLASLPKPRPGFNYGHGGAGRGPTLMSNIGNSDWKDYCVEFEFCVTGVDPAFNPYGLGTDFHNGLIFFHIADAKESWNEQGLSAYLFRVDGDGAWKLECVYNDYCAVPAGYGANRRDADRTLASGSGLKVDRVNGNKFRIEVRGKRIQVWVDGDRVVDVADEKMGDKIGGQTLDHGGVGFHWGFDAMGWIRNFSAHGL